MKSPARKFLLRLTIALLSVTAVLGIISVLWPGLRGTGSNILDTTIQADVAAVLALCCVGRATSAWHRAIQVTGTASACLALAGGSYLTWRAPGTGSLTEGILRATAVLLILAVASAHSSLVLPSRSVNRAARTLVTGTVLCIGAAAELIANYVLFPGFNPGGGYLRALTVILILDALGTILILLTHRFGLPRAEAAAPRAPAGGQPPGRQAAR